MSHDVQVSLEVAFKSAFRLHQTGIAVITALTPQGPVGLTASSVASVGLDPPSLAFSVTRATGSAGGILTAPSFVVHLIGAAELAVAQSFAVSGAPRFTADQGWTALPSGEPYLASAHAALRGHALSITPVGSSSVVIAQIDEVLLGPESEPLTYYDRTFHRLGPAV